ACVVRCRRRRRGAGGARRAGDGRRAPDAGAARRGCDLRAGKTAGSGQTMIDSALKFLVNELNAYLFARTGVSTGGVDLGRLVDDTGKVAIKDDSIGAALVNVEEERTLKSQLPDTV